MTKKQTQPEKEFRPTIGSALMMLSKLSDKDRDKLSDIQYEAYERAEAEEEKLKKSPAGAKYRAAMKEYEEMVANKKRRGPSNSDFKSQVTKLRNSLQLKGMTEANYKKLCELVEKYQGEE